MHDILFGIRLLYRRVGASIIIVLVLALGIGANTAMFTVVNAVLLRPLPYKHSDRLALVWQSSDQHRSTGESFNTYSEFEQWQHNARSFEKLAALTWAVSERILFWHGKAQNVLAIPTSVDFFSMLEVRPVVGRTFQQSDLSQDCTAVVSHAFWQNQLGAPADLVGQSIRLDQQDCRVVGIMSKDFSFYPVQTALWTLITPSSPYEKDPWHSVTGIFGRLKRGVSRSAAQSELEALERNILPQAPDDLLLPHQAMPVVLDLQSEFTWLAGRNLRTALLVLLAAVLLVLLIACVNVANLLLAQAADRHKELAIRASLGATQIRIVRQLLVESILLSSAGGVLGGLLAFVAVRIFRATNPIELPPGNPVAVNWEVLVFTAFMAFLAAALFGLAPAWKAARLDLNEALRSSGQSLSQGKKARRAVSLLVIAEIGISVVLLTGAGLLIQSLARLVSTPLGFRTDHLLTASLHLPQQKYRNPDEKIHFRNRVAAQVASIPGVQEVSLASSLYLVGSNVLAIDGQPFSRETAEHNVGSEMIDDTFLRVMGIPLLRGRVFGSADRRNTQPVALINQALADKYFPNNDAIGRAIKLGPPESSDPWLTIVGIVGNIKTVSVFQEMGYVVIPAVYQPFAQKPPASISLLVRTGDDPFAVADPLEERLHALDSEVTLANVKTMTESLSELQSQPRFRTILLSTFAGLALLLAALGIYGALSQSVSQRTQEIGIRMALGADHRTVMRMILKQVLNTVVGGLAIGISGALLLLRLAAGLFYEVRPDNPWVLAAVSALLTLFALCASYFPVRRATAIDPLQALRTE